MSWPPDPLETWGRRAPAQARAGIGLVSHPGRDRAAPLLDLPNDAMRVDLIAEMFTVGHGRQILLSHELCNKTRLSRYGGEGYGRLLTRTVPIMRRKGFSADDLAVMFVENPARMLIRA